MKKVLLLSAALGMMLFTACHHSESTSTSKYNFITYNFVTSLADGTSEIVPSVYTYDLDLIAQTMTMSTNFSADNTNLNVLSEQIPFEGFYYNLDGSLYEILSFKKLGLSSASNANAVTNLKGEFTLLANYPPEISGLPDVYLPNGRYILMSYDYGNKYNVRTMWTDMTFTGSTTTSFSAMGATQSYTTKDAKYRVILNIKEKKATVIIYDAKFAEQMPSITNIVLKDLPLTLNSYGYTISGTNVVPEVYESGTGVPNNKYTFDEFEFSSEGNLTQGTCRYKVAGAMNGYFSGTYLTALETLNPEK